MHTKINVYVKYSLPFYFAFKSNWAEHFNGIHCADNVTLDSRFSEGLHILSTSIIAGYVHFLYRFCNPKNILLDLHRSPIEFETKKKL